MALLEPCPFDRGTNGVGTRQSRCAAQDGSRGNMRPSRGCISRVHAMLQNVDRRTAVSRVPSRLAAQALWFLWVRAFETKKNGLRASHRAATLTRAPSDQGVEFDIP